MTAPRRALIVIDVQNEYFSGILQIQHPPREKSLAAIAQVIDESIAAGIPFALVEHEYPEGFPVFGAGSEVRPLHPEIADRADRAALRSVKSLSSVFHDEDLLAWLREEGIDTVTLVGYMTNNCVLASSAGAEPLGLTVEVLSDATGAISIANAAGTVPAKQVHETLMTVLHSNWARVAKTEAWASAVRSGEALPSGNFIDSATEGRQGS